MNVTNRQTKRASDRCTDHATPCVALGRYHRDAAYWHGTTCMREFWSDVLRSRRRRWIEQRKQARTELCTHTCSQTTVDVGNLNTWTYNSRRKLNQQQAHYSDFTSISVDLFQTLWTASFHIPTMSSLQYYTGNNAATLV